MHRLVIALVALLGLTGAAVVAAYLLLFAAGTDRAARLVPADAVAYVNVYLRPSTGQQMNLAALLGRFPGFADEASLDDKVDQLVQNVLAQTGVDYRADVKPWLGDQLAVAVLPADGEAPDGTPVVIAEVSDVAAAEAALPRLAAQAGASLSTSSYAGVELQVASDVAYAFVDDLVVVAPDASTIEAVIDVHGGAEALADRAEFTRTMADVPADHLAAAFIDLAGITDAAGVDEQLRGLSTAGAVLVAEPDGLRVSASAPLASDEADSSPRSGAGDQPSTLVDWMPADTIAEVVVFDLRQTLEDAEAAAAEVPEGEEVVGALDTFRALAALGLGVDLESDVLPLLDREVAFAFAGFDDEGPSGQLLLRPSDADAAAEALDRMATALGRLGAETSTEEHGSGAITVLDVPELGEVAYAVSDGTVIMGLGADDVIASLEAHEGGTGLSGTEAYLRTFEVAGARAGTEGWLDVQAALPLLGDAVPTAGDAQDMLAQIGTFGFTVPSRDDAIEMHAVLTIEPARPD